MENKRFTEATQVLKELMETHPANDKKAPLARVHLRKARELEMKSSDVSDNPENFGLPDTKTQYTGLKIQPRKQSEEKTGLHIRKVQPLWPPHACSIIQVAMVTTGSIAAKMGLKTGQVLVAATHRDKKETARLYRAEVIKRITELLEFKNYQNIETLFVLETSNIPECTNLRLEAGESIINIPKIERTVGLLLARSSTRHNRIPRCQRGLRPHPQTRTAERGRRRTIRQDCTTAGQRI